MSMDLLNWKISSMDNTNSKGCFQGVLKRYVSWLSDILGYMYLHQGRPLINPLRFWQCKATSKENGVFWQKFLPNQMSQSKFTTVSSLGKNLDVFVNFSNLPKFFLD